MSVTGYLIWFIATTVWVTTIVAVGIAIASGAFSRDRRARGAGSNAPKR